MSENPYKKLGGQTIVYGLGTIVPRLLNYLILTIYYTRVLKVQEFGIITELYAYISVFIVILTFGFETSYFKFSTDTDKNKLFSTSFLTLFLLGLVFIFLCYLFIDKIALFLEYTDFKIYIKFTVLIIAVDAITNLFIAKLRIERKIKKFVFVQLLNVVLIIGLVLFFIEILPGITKNGLFGNYTYKEKVYYIFLANIIASIIRIVILFSEFRKIEFTFDKILLKKILIYSLPLLISQLSGIFNETLDRLMLRKLLPVNTDALYEMGIYGANLRIAVLMTLFIQMFRYAAEPFYFNYFKAKDSRKIYAEILKYFLIFCLGIFLLVTLYLHFFKYFIDIKFHEGLGIVPIILFSSILTGIIFNLSIWYKLQDKTYYGIYIIGSGVLINVFLNIMLIPKYGYFGCAITRLISNIFMVILSFYWSQKFFKIPYEMKRILMYITLALVLYGINIVLVLPTKWLEVLWNTFLFSIFIIIANRKEKLVDIFFKSGNENKNS